MNNVLIALFALGLAGCASTGTNIPSKPDIVYVDKIITKDCPVPKYLTLPDLYIYQLSPQDSKDPGKVAQVYKATIKQLMGAVQERDAILNSYRKPVETK